MDKWIAKYLEEWQTDFGAEPDAESSFKFVKDALMAFKNLLPSGSSSITRLEAVASLIATRVNKQDDPRDFLQYLQGVIFEAAAISPLDPSDLTEVIRIFLQKLSTPDAEWFRYDFAKNTRERWNGPDTPGAEKNKEQCIQEWVSLNMLIAHLTRLHTISLETYALRTFYRTFDTEASENQLDYNVPASGAWIDILGKEIF
ncbi:hypothetical protein ETB97_003338 [Aspergillus alliaceus]|uniref:Uncharacterized protein n=1 Tax=Petromyces alliaceus TaxID=209559 RepID=A0A8H6AEE7_PETAA|nr:hypothetical protein ETB97_003338 [Aspergillus burnettii]